MNNRKQLHTFHLIGLDASGKPLTPQNCNSDLSVFKCKEMSVAVNNDGIWTISTEAGNYELSRHPSLNMYTCVAKSCKVHVTIKKMSATVRTWY